MKSTVFKRNERKAYIMENESTYSHSKYNLSLQVPHFAQEEVKPLETDLLHHLESLLYFVRFEMVFFVILCAYRLPVWQSNT